MKLKNITRLSLGALAFAASIPLATAATTFISGNITTGTNWDNGLPTISNPGFINPGSVGTFANAMNFGSTSVVDMTGGTFTATNALFNYQSGTFNMSGGYIAPRVLLANGSTAVFNLSGGTVALNASKPTRQFSAQNGGTMNISGTVILDGTNSDANPNVTGSGTYNILTGWSGSWKEALMTETPGATWKEYVTTNTSHFKLDGASIDNAIFDANFLVTNGGSTLTLVPEPSSLALLGLGGICFLRRRR